MNNATKLFSSLTLLAAGFGGAWIVGPPELTEGLVHRLLPQQPIDSSALRPLGPDSFAPPYVAAPAGGSSATPPATAPAPPTFAPSPGPTPPATFVASPLPAAVALTESEPGPAVTRRADAEWFDAWPTLPEAASLPASSAPAAAAPSWWDQPVAGPAAPPEAAVASHAPPEPAWLEPRGDDRGDSTKAPTIAAAAAPAFGPSFGPRPDQSSVQPAAGWFDAQQRIAGFAPATSADITPIAPLGSPTVDEPLDRAPQREPRWGSHVVSDGDTLERLAERYLGAASRAGELFELNRDRLTSPELLPIGLVLKTPPRESARRGEAAEPAPFSMISAPLPSASGEAASVAVERPLVPVGSPVEGDPWQASEDAWPADQPVMARDLAW